MVPRTGLEPVQPKGRGILSPLCLPISPSGQGEIGKKRGDVRGSAAARVRRRARRFRVGRPRLRPRLPGFPRERAARARPCGPAGLRAQAGEFPG